MMVLERKLFLYKEIIMDKVIYVAVVQSILFPKTVTDKEIEEKLNELFKGKDYIWSENKNILEEK